MRAGKNLTAYTIGYEGMTIEAFIASLRAQRIAHLVDIREVALSRKKGFSKTALSEHLERVGIRYSHVRALGCPKPIRDQYRVDGNWERYSRAFAAYLESQAPALRELMRTVKADRYRSSGKVGTAMGREVGRYVAAHFAPPATK